jgi:hypothetical protein
VRGGGRGVRGGTGAVFAGPEIVFVGTEIISGEAQIVSGERFAASASAAIAHAAGNRACVLAICMIPCTFTQVVHAMDDGVCTRQCIVWGS